MKLTTIIAFILVIIGAINWLLVGVFSFDLVAYLFGTMTILTRVIYGLVGVASLWVIFFMIMYKPFRKLA